MYGPNPSPTWPRGARREWATFRSPDDDRICQLYWWQTLGVYIVGRYDDEGRLARVGHFLERDTAIGSVIQEGS